MKKSIKLAAILLAGALMLDSKYNITTTEYEIKSENLPAAFEDFHIVQISDLHGDMLSKNNEIIAEKIKALKPDLIAITGDMADNMKNIHVFEILLRQLVGIAPIYFVNGNHEQGGLVAQQVEELVESYGAEHLGNEYHPIYRNGERIIIAGVDDPMGREDMIKPDALVEKLRQDYPDEFTLLLGHRNYWVRDYYDLPVDLILSGHAHGGIVRLPIIGGLFNVSHRLFADYEIGLYEGEQFTMCVNRGLGNSVPVPRLFNRPEIVNIKLRQA